jgi:hypothetical protein
LAQEEAKRGVQRDRVCMVLGCAWPHLTLFRPEPVILPSFWSKTLVYHGQLIRCKIRKCATELVVDQ